MPKAPCLKALTLWQPWASLICFEEKRVETRCWETKYRGPLAIHAALKQPPDWLGETRWRNGFEKHLLQASITHGWGKALPVGCVLCIVNLRAIQRANTVRADLSDKELLFGNYEDDRYAWFLELLHRFDPPIPAKGNRLLWNWHPEHEVSW